MFHHFDLKMCLVDMVLLCILWSFMLKVTALYSTVSHFPMAFSALEIQVSLVEWLLFTSFSTYFCLEKPDRSPFDSGNAGEQ